MKRVLFIEHVPRPSSPPPLSAPTDSSVNKEADDSRQQGSRHESRNTCPSPPRPSPYSPEVETDLFRYLGRQGGGHDGGSCHKSIDRKKCVLPAQKADKKTQTHDLFLPCLRVKKVHDAVIRTHPFSPSVTLPPTAASPDPTPFCPRAERS